MLEEIRDVYRRLSVAFPWREGDVLLLDNMLVAHGRALPGPRKILVAMAEAYRAKASEVLSCKRMCSSYR